MSGDLKRLARNARPDVQRVGPGLFRVNGDALPHLVEKHIDGWSCDCSDFASHGGSCMHVLKVRMASGDRKILRALRLLIPTLQEDSGNVTAR